MFGSFFATTDAFLGNILLFLTSTTGNLGLAIIVFTLIIRAVLLPISYPTLKAQTQNRDKLKKVQAEMKDIKKKHKGDQAKINKAQTELYKKYNLNPLAGCLPTIVQLIVFGLLYHALFVFFGNQTEVSTQFLWLDLASPDQTYIFPVLAALTQLVLSVMILPGGETADVIPNNSKKPAVKKQNDQEQDTAEMAESMQKQMMFLMPIMTGVVAIGFPSGLVLYWVTTTAWSVVQQYFISGWGGLITYPQRAVSTVRGWVNK